MRGGKEENNMSSEWHKDLEKRAYKSLDAIESERDQRAKYDYLNIVTVVLFRILDSVLAIR